MKTKQCHQDLLWPLEASRSGAYFCSSERLGSVERGWALLLEVEALSDSARWNGRK